MIALIFDSALRSSALAALVWAVVALIRVRNFHLEKSIWATVLCAAILMPLVLKWHLSPWMALLGMPSLSLHSISFVDSLAEISIRANRLARGSDAWLRTVTGIYIFVAAALLLRFTIAFGRVWRVRRAASRIAAAWTCGIDVRMCARLVTPVTFGSTLLVPPDFESWSEMKRRAVIAHEGAHIRALDCYLQWLAALYLCVFWFSPLSWWLRNRLATLAEHASDDAVLSELTDVRADYADLLLEAARTRAGIVTSDAGAVTSMAGGNMTRRIDRILSGGAPHRAPRVWQRLLVISLLLPTAAFTAADTGVVNGAPPSGEHPTPKRDWPPSATSKPGLNADGAYIVAGPSDGLEPWYPADAKRKGIEGRVSIAVTLDTAGRATDTRLLAEFPDGVGFGAAASAMAHHMTYTNPSGHTTTLVFMVKFELDGHPGTSQPGTTNFETGEHTATPAQ